MKKNVIKTIYIEVPQHIEMNVANIAKAANINLITQLIITKSYGAYFFIYVYSALGTSLFKTTGSSIVNRFSQK